MKKTNILFLLTSALAVTCAHFAYGNMKNPKGFIADSTVSMDPTKYGPDAIKNAFDNSCIYETTAFYNKLSVDIKTYYSLPSSQKTAKNEVVLYICNTAEERQGQEDDVSIVGDFLQNSAVIVVDFHNSKFAFGKHLTSAVNQLYRDVYNNKKFLSGITANTNRIFLIPAGDRLVKDIPYFDLLNSGAKGDKEYIVDVWNHSSSQNKFGSYWSRATVIDDIKMKNGESLTTVGEDGWHKYTTYKMNITYPSHPKKPVSVIMNAYTGNAYRNNGVILSDGNDRLGASELTLKGYAVATYDHPYIPYMFENGNGGSYGHFEKAGSSGNYGQMNYSMSFYDGNKAHTAAVRCLKYFADDYGYSKENFGVFGHSKASWVSCLSIQDPEKDPEALVYPQIGGHKYCNIERQNPEFFPNASISVGTYKLGETYGPQPYLTYKDGTPIDSNVKAVYHSMGYGSERYEYIASHASKPTYICAGKGDDRNPYAYWDAEVAAYEAADLPLYVAKMDEYGHTYPVDDIDTVYNYNYHEQFIKFFDYFVDGINPEVVYTSVKNNAISGSDGIFVQFLGSMKEESVKQNVKILDSNNAEIVGNWTDSRGKTRFTFDSSKLVEGSTYKLVVGKDVTDTNNKCVGWTQEFSFVF